MSNTLTAAGTNRAPKSLWLGCKQYRIFVDDKKNPPKTKSESRWVVCRSLEEFVKTIMDRGIPEFIGYDAELEKGGETVQCIDWLWDWCGRHGREFPRWSVHSKGALSVALKGKLLREFSGQYYPDGYGQ